MADAAVAIDGLKALKIALHLAAEVAFYEHLLRVDRVNNGIQLLRRQIFSADIRVDIGDLKDPLGIAWANSVDIGKRSFNALVARNFYAKESGHNVEEFGLGLPV